MTTGKRVIKAAMRWCRSSGYVYRGMVCNGTVVNVVTNKAAADELEKACAAHKAAHAAKRK